MTSPDDPQLQANFQHVIVIQNVEPEIYARLSVQQLFHAGCVLCAATIRIYLII